MDKQIVETLLKGVGVIIDDEVDSKDDSPARSLVESLRNANVPVVMFNRIPEGEVIDSLGSISFIVLDWRFGNSTLENFEDVILPDEIKNSTSATLSFLQKLLNRWFVPVFLITGIELSQVTDVLKENGLFFDDQPNRIMINTKSDIRDYDSLVENVGVWLENMPSAYTLKIWEREAEYARNQMFMDLYQASPGWVNVLLQCMKQDTDNNNSVIDHEFTELLNNNFTNRMRSGRFSDITSDPDRREDAETLRKVIQGERFVAYDQNSLPEISFLGDLYRKGENTYYLNIRAQCDLIREQDPMLYLLEGKAKDRNLVKQPSNISLKKSDRKICLKVNNTSHSLEDLMALNGQGRADFNKILCEVLNPKYIFNQGEVVEKKIHSLVTCIADQYIIEFSFRSFFTKKRSEFEGQEIERIGKLIPPYITRVQKSFASFLMREGVMAIPQDLFE